MTAASSTNLNFVTTVYRIACHGFGIFRDAVTSPHLLSDKIYGAEEDRAGTPDVFEDSGRSLKTRS